MLQRFLPLLAVLAALTGLSGFPLRAQAAIHNQGDAPIAQTDSQCPDVPDRQDPTIDFCSPKLLGNVAGPYGAHIVLATENIQEPAPLWILVNGEQPINDTAKLIDCLNQKQFCSSMNGPTKQTNNEGKKNVYAFSWNNSNLPAKPGDYYIEIMSQKNGKPDQFIAATPVAYTLLNTQAPCITLSLNDQVLTNCRENPQNMLRLATTKSTLTIQGTNWLLGKKDQNINYQVHISVQCTTQNQCSKKSLFDTFSSVHNDGSFSITQPLSNTEKGTYTISATDLLPHNTTIDPNQSDYLPFNQNSIVNGSLVISPITFTLQPSSPQPSVNWSTYAIAGIIPAFLGLSIFLLLLLLTHFQLSTQLAQSQAPITNAQQTNPPQGSASYPPLSGSLSDPSSSQGSGSEKISIDFLLREVPFLPFPLQENPQTPLAQATSLPLLQRNTPQTIEKVRRQWQHKGSMEAAKKTLAPLLNYDVASSKKLLKQLNLPSTSPLTQQKIQQLTSQVRNALLLAHHEKTNRQKLCSELLISCAALFSTSADPFYQAALQYSMGQAYALLAINSPPTTTALLEEAERNFQAAFDTIAKNSSNDLLRTFSAILQVAIGDINAAKALIPQTNYNQTLNCYGMATTAYQIALNITTDPSWKVIIQERWQRIDQQRNVHKR